MRLEHSGFLADTVTAYVNLKGLARFTILAHCCSRNYIQFAHVLDATVRELLEDTSSAPGTKNVAMYLLRYLDAYADKGGEIKYVHSSGPLVPQGDC